jgi:outer membrane immunogenic protein
MRKSFIVIAALAIASSAASAADLSMPFKAPPAPAAAFSWTGCYLGGQVGIGSETDGFTSLAGGVGLGSGNGANGYGPVACGQIGCNYQTGLLVVGIEGDGLWSGVNNQNALSAAAISEELQTKDKWEADVAGRVGVAFDRLLVYGKGGVAWGGFGFSGNSAGAAISGTATLPGALFGVGLEYAFAPKWSAKIEYNYIAYAQQTVTFTGTGLAGLSAFSVGADEQLVKVGLNYKLF